MNYIYDYSTSSLYGADGEFIKRVHCPQAIRPEYLQPIVGNERSRRCDYCRTDVVNLDTADPDDLEEMVANGEHLCVFFTGEAKNVVTLHRRPSVGAAELDGYERQRLNELCDSPELTTVMALRSLESMQHAARQGFRLLFRDVGPEHKYGQSKFCLYQHKVTGELQSTEDYRMPPPGTNTFGSAPSSADDWRVVKDWCFVREGLPFPLGAYAIPKGLPVGSGVFLPDVLEDLRVGTYNQGEGEPLTSGLAVWNGTDLEILMPLVLEIVG